MHKPLSTIFTSLLAAAALPASAMNLNPQGTGEVLLFPYYTVNAGQATLISLTNTTDKPKYLSANLREGYNGRLVLDFNIALAPHDSWTATLYAADEQGRAVLHTRDVSCTAPDKNSWEAAPDGGWQVGLLDRNYIGNNQDGGPITPARTREGYLAIVERAELAGTLAAAAGQGGTRDCTRLRSFSPSNPDLRTPGGGLYGNFSIVNVAEGILIGGAATAIDNYAAGPLFWDTANYRDILTLGAVDVASNSVSAQVYAGGRLTEVSYPASVVTPGPVDAVSALLMTESLYGDFEQEDAYGIRSEWLITAPTKYLYTDRRELGLPAGENSPRPPFREVFNSVHEGGACMPFTLSGADREGRELRFDPPAALSPPPAPPRYPSHNLCHAVGVIHFDGPLHNIYQPPAPLGQGPLTPVLGSHLGVGVEPIVAGSVAGIARLELGVRRGYVSWDGGGEPGGPSFLPPGLRGPGLRGLPVIGFQAVRYVNAAAQPGVLASYTRGVPLAASTVCTDAAGVTVICP